MGKKINLSGQKFGRLTVIEEAPHQASGRVCWSCKCDCGNTKIVTSHELRSGDTRSCGCLQSESRRDRLTTHGERNTRLYNSWANMKQRCYCHSQQNYKHYGGRGITVCEEWKRSFEAFRDWAFANGYRDDLTIDRIDTNGNYEPSNCRWATINEQRNNMRSNINLEYKGQTHTLAEWAKIIGINYGTLQQRIGKLKWSAEKALTTPVRVMTR